MESRAPTGVRDACDIAGNDRWAVASTSPDAIFRAHYARLVEAIAAVTGDDDFAADAVQEAFVQLWKHLWKHWDDVRLYEDPVGWVRRVAINRAFNRRRSLARRAVALLRLTPGDEATVIEDAGLGSPVIAAFRSLPGRQRLAMGLHYVADLSVAEVAQAMDVSEGSVKQHLHRGREAMRRSLEVEP